MTHGIPTTYVPARNTVFLALALAWAETLGAFDIWIGVNCVDYSGYPDCRPEYLRAFEALANLATRAGVEGTGRFRIHAPLLTLNKQQIIERGRALGVDYSRDAQLLRPEPRRPVVRSVRRLLDSPVGVRAAGPDGPDSLPAYCQNDGPGLTSRPTHKAGRRAGFLFRSDCGRRRGG